MKYLFDHFLVNGETHAGPSLSLQVMGDVDLIAVYVEEKEPTLVNLTYTSTPIAVDALINDVQTSSESSTEFEEGSIVNIKATPQVVVDTVTYRFDHFLVDGEVYGGPQIVIQMMGDAQITAVYVEETEPVPPPPDYSKYILPIIVIGTTLLKKKD